MSTVSDKQKEMLEQAFTTNEGITPDGTKLKELATTAGLEEPEVRSWFVKKRKRVKKNKNKKKQNKKKKIAAAAQDTYASKYQNNNSNSTKSSAVLQLSPEALREEIQITTSELKQDSSNSELYYRRGSALISLGRDLSRPSKWGPVRDEDSWNKGLQDLEKAHQLRYIKN